MNSDPPKLPPPATKNSNGQKKERRKGDNRKDHVKYARSCSVILIPSRNEYAEAGINLWYNRSDQLSAQTQVKNELKTLLDFNPILTIRSAMKYLYQPKRSETTPPAPEQTKEPLSIVIIDSDIDSNRETYDTVLKGLRSQEKLEIDCKSIYSAQIALQTLADFPSADVILMDENACNDGNLDVFQLRTKLKKLNKTSSALYGLLIENNEECEHKRHDAVEDGFDFIWPKPIAKSIDMLPLMVTESKRVTATTINNNNNNDSKGYSNTSQSTTSITSKCLSASSSSDYGDEVVSRSGDKQVLLTSTSTDSFFEEEK